MCKQTNVKNRTLLTKNALLFFILVLTLSTILLVLKVIGEGIWLGALSLFLMGSSIIYFSEVLLSFDLKKLKITLADINEKEASIRELAVVTSEIVQLSSKINYQVSSPEYETLNKQLLIATSKLNELTK